MSTIEIDAKSSRSLMADSCEDPDSRLLFVIAGGERRALEALYLSYHPRLMRFLARLIPRRGNVEEIINDTFMVVWRNAGGFRSDSRVSTWIFGIAYRTALKSMRRERNHAAAQNLDDCPEPSVDPVLDTEVQDWVEQGLERLPDEQRLAVELAYNMGHSMEEIAAISGTPVATVKTRMFHARQKLRHYLPALGGSVGSNFRSC